MTTITVMVFQCPLYILAQEYWTLFVRAVDDYFSLLYYIYIYDLYTAKGIKVIKVISTENIYMHMHIQPWENKGNRNLEHINRYIQPRE